MPFKDKSPLMKTLLDDQARKTFGRSVSEALDGGVCVKCGHEALPRCSTEPGKREYHISGLCEICWDEIMGEPESDSDMVGPAASAAFVAAEEVLQERSKPEMHLEAMVSIDQANGHVDITTNVPLVLSVRRDGRVLWLNSPTKCLLRICCNPTAKEAKITVERPEIGDGEEPLQG